MSSPAGKRDVIRLRTFAEDVERVRSEKGITEPLDKDILPKDEETVESKGVLKKIKKKSLDLQEQRTGTALDSDGITFDEETATKVVEQAYEANKSVAEEAAAKTSGLEDQASPVDFFGGQAVEKSAADFLSQRSKGTSTTSGMSVAAPTPTVDKTPLTTPTAVEVASIKAVPESVLSDAGQVHELSAEEVGGGEIVSDKKRDRFKLLPAIGTAVSEWVDDKKVQLEEIQKEKHTIEKTEKRIETIKAAAQPKTLAPTNADFDQVAQRLRETKKNMVSETPVVIKPKQPVVARWSHVTPEPGSEQVAPEATPTENTIPDPAEVGAVFASAPIEPIVETPVALSAPAAVAPTPEAPIERHIENANLTLADLAGIAGAARAPESEPSPQPEIPRGTLAREAHQQIAAQEAFREATKEAAGRTFTMPTVSLPDLSTSKEYLPTPTLAILVVIIAIIAGVGTSVFFFWQPDQEVVAPIVTTNPLFTAQLQADVQLDASHSATMSTLLSAVNSTPGSLYLYLTRNGGQTVVPPNEVMDFLAPQAPGAFTRSVTNVSFGSQDNRPFIIMRVNNFDNAFSGMLAWEQTMSADLAPLFGPVVTESLDPQARTSSQTRGAFFRDVVASNLSSRLLVNERGEDRILYAFLDRQTIVITTDRMQLANILPLIR